MSKIRLSAKKKISSKKRIPNKKVFIVINGQDDLVTAAYITEKNYCFYASDFQLVIVFLHLPRYCIDQSINC